MQQIECTANGTGKTETIVSSYMKSVTAQQPWPEHSFVKPVSGRKLLEDEEKLEVRTIPFGEKMN